MRYLDIMDILSQCGLGGILLSADETILALNQAGDQLLHGNGELVGKQLANVAPQLCPASGVARWENTAFSEYIIRCSTLKADDLPPDTTLLAFRDVADQVYRSMLEHILQQISESVILCDAKGRICYLNDAAAKMDSIVASEVFGENIANVYNTRDRSALLVPSVISDKRPLRSVCQHYTTRYGKNVDIVCSSFPIIENGQVLGGFSLMKDWSMVSTLHRQIIDLQEKLTIQSMGTGRRKQGKGKSMLTAKYNFDDIIHVSSAMEEVICHCRMVADSDSSVMIYGETGTGKELFAQSIHNASKRMDGPFIAINCAALPENLLEGLLFGTEKGAYTGAESRVGLFEQADHGTLLLDELNSMNINLQSKLLRVLQDGVIRRVGGTSDRQVDVRILSNINIPPHQAIQEGKLRRDLFYRLGVVNVTIPPLRQRTEDISLLIQHFINQYNQKLNKNVKSMDHDALMMCCQYNWPGNVRELQHVIEHALNIMPHEVSMISPKFIYILQQEKSPFLQNLQLSSSNGEATQSLNQKMQVIERETICKTLCAYGGNISRSAAVLNMSRQNLQYRIKRFQIDVDALMQEYYKGLHL